MVALGLKFEYALHSLVPGEFLRVAFKFWCVSIFVPNKMSTVDYLAEKTISSFINRMCIYYNFPDFFCFLCKLSSYYIGLKLLNY